eukprot:1223774-Amphidinium_carterae.1
MCLVAAEVSSQHTFGGSKFERSERNNELGVQQVHLSKNLACHQETSSYRNLSNIQIVHDSLHAV